MKSGPGARSAALDRSARPVTHGYCGSRGYAAVSIAFRLSFAPAKERRLARGETGRSGAKLWGEAPEPAKFERPRPGAGGRDLAKGFRQRAFGRVGSRRFACTFRSRDACRGRGHVRRRSRKRPPRSARRKPSLGLHGRPLAEGRRSSLSFRCPFRRRRQVRGRRYGSSCRRTRPREDAFYAPVVDACVEGLARGVDVQMIAGVQDEVVLCRGAV